MRQTSCLSQIGAISPPLHSSEREKPCLTPTSRILEYVSSRQGERCYDTPKRELGCQDGAAGRRRQLLMEDDVQSPVEHGLTNLSAHRWGQQYSSNYANIDVHHIDKAHRVVRILLGSRFRGGGLRAYQSYQDQQASEFGRALGRYSPHEGAPGKVFLIRFCLPWNTSRISSTNATWPVGFSCSAISDIAKRVAADKREAQRSGWPNYFTAQTAMLPCLVIRSPGARRSCTLGVTFDKCELRLYKAIIRLRMTYAATVWEYATITYVRKPYMF